MLHTSCHTVLLDTFHIRNHHLSGKVRVLTHILEITSIKRSTADVDSRTEKDVLLAVTRLFTDAAAIKEGHFLVPCRRKINKSRESRAGVIGPSCLIPLVPKHFGTDSVRTVSVPYFRDTQTRHSTRTELGLSCGHSHLFLKCHACKRILNPILYGSIWIKIGRTIELRMTAAGSKSHCKS